MAQHSSKHLAAVEKTAKRLSDAETRLDSARKAFYAAVSEALGAGESISDIARIRGVSRQAIQKLADRLGLPR